MKSKTPLLFGSLVAGFAGFAGMVFAPQAEATLLMYEGFSYGASNNVALTSLSGSALGLDGTAYTGSTNVQYQSAGLIFGDLQVEGGNANLGYQSGAFNANRGLDFTLTSGTLYGSYLFQAYDDAGGTGGISPVMFGATDSDNTVELAVAGNTSGAGVISGLKSYSTTTGGTGIASGATQTINSTYLVLFQVGNLGAANGQIQTVDMWVLSEAQFANFKVDGLTSTELQAAALGDQSTNVWQRLSYNLTVSGGNNISLTDTDLLTLFSYRSKYRVDEIRISNSSLDEVTPVPEPAAVAMLIGGLSILAIRRRTKLI